MLPSFLSRPDPSVYLRDNYVVLDFEVDTSHGDFGSPVHPANRLLLACWRTGKDHPHSCRNVWDMPEWTSSTWADEYGMDQLLRAIKEADFIVAHNAKYELGWLRRCGLDLHNVLVFDTKIAEYVLLGNLAAGDETMLPRSTSLDMCCLRRGLADKDPVVDRMIKDGINPVRIPHSWLEGRCRRDVETTEQLFLDQRRHLHVTGRLPVQYTRCLLTPVLADIEPNGMTLDAAAVAEQYERASAELAQLEQRMAAMTGGINWRSTKQSAEFIYDKLGFQELRRKSGEPLRTKKGARRADNKTLDKLEARTKEQRDFIALRKTIGAVNALLAKNLAFFAGVCVEYGGTFHAEFNQTATATHRLSSSGIELTFQTILNDKGRPTRKRVQFQNMPRKLKPLFRARREGWLMAEADGSQLEFRIAVELGDDEQGMRDILDPNWDAHVTSASAMEQIPYDKLYAAYKAGDDKAAAMRQAAKTETFKPLYGGKKGSKKQERWYRAFRERYPGIAATQHGWVTEVINTKRLVTPWGMRYYWPRVRVEQSGYCNVETAVYNYPIQAFATAEVIPVALVYFWHRIAERGLQDRVIIVNTVHDSIVCEIAPDAAEEFEALAKQCFTLDVYDYIQQAYGYEFKVPLGCGIKIGTHWGKGEEKAYNVFRDGRQERVK